MPTEVTQPRTPTANASLISAFATLKDKQGLPSVFLSFWENGGPDSYRDNRSVTITLKGAGGAAPTKAMEYRIDEEHANPLAAWQAMGSPDEPTQDQLDQLEAFLVRLGIPGAGGTPGVAEEAALLNRCALDYLQTRCDEEQHGRSAQAVVVGAGARRSKS